MKQINQQLFDEYGSLEYHEELRNIKIKTAPMKQTINNILSDWTELHNDFQDNMIKDALAGQNPDEAMLNFCTGALTLMRKNVQNDEKFFNILDNSKQETQVFSNLQTIKEDANEVGALSQIKTVPEY